MFHIGNIEQFDESTGDWPTYVERVEHFFKVNKVPDELRVSGLLSLLGSKTYKLLRSLTAPDPPADKTFPQIVALMKDHFHPKPLVRTERFRFHKRNQAEGESAQSYLAELRRLSEHCDFGASLNDMLCDRFVVGLKNDAVQKKLLMTRDLTVHKAVDIAVSMDTAEKDTLELNANSASKEQVNLLNKGYNYKPKRDFDRAANKTQQSRDSFCWRCGNSNHSEQNCKFKFESCRKCGKQGHIMRRCLSEVNVRKPQADKVFKRKTNNQSVTVRQLNMNPQEDFDIFTMKNDCSRPFTIPMIIEGKKMNMEIDTGAAVSVISLDDYKRTLDHLPLEKTDITLLTYTGEKVIIQGLLIVTVNYQDQCERLKLYVVEKGGPALIGRDWLHSINIDWNHVKSLQSETTSVDKGKLTEILDKHKTLFKDELGTITGIQANLVLKEGATPKFMKARPVPYSLKPLVDKELDRLVTLGVLTPIGFSDWATPIVPVIKRDGTVRICGDYKVTLNPMLEVEKYPLPKVEDMFASLSGGKKFSKLDLSQAYQQIQVNEESAKYLTINTHRGLFQVNRLSYGVASAPSIFQKAMDQILQGITGVMCYLDDTLTTGENDDAHLRNLDCALTRMEEYGIRLKTSKCEFLKEEIEYLGHVISADGLQPSPKNVEAIINAPRPENITQLRSFLGMVNYYGKFLPNLSTVLKPLHQMLEKDCDWNWDKSHEDAVLHVKTLLTSNKVLTHFDPGLPITLSCDASAYGIGAVLAHVVENGERPIAFASRTLSKAERGYSQIEKEALSLIFGIKKFHQYLFGQHFTLVTDHLPLVNFFGSKVGIPTLAAARLQRWALLLAAHSYDIQYRNTKAHANADGLSRLPLVDETSYEDDTVEVYNLSQINRLPVTHKTVAQETKRDAVLSQALLQTSLGWTEPTDDNMKPFFHRRNELTIQSGCLMWGIRVVVPSVLREAVLKEIHMAHAGVVRMKAVARSYVWWPSMDAEIEKTAANCPECRVLRNAPTKAPLHPWSLPGLPWQRLHMDFAGPFLGTNFLVVVDAYSKWPEVFILSDITSARTIECLRTVFARFGIPEQLVSDNGASFTSEEFKEFIAENGIKHIFSAPYHPASNGQAERFVQTLKKGMKPKDDGRSLQQRLAAFLLTYRNTPHATTGESPAMVLQKRRLRTRMDLIKPSVETRARESQTSQEMYRDRKCKDRSFASGDSVLVRDYRVRGDKWIPGTLTDQSGPVSYNIEVFPGLQWRRHQDQILKSVPNIEDDLEFEETPSPVKLPYEGPVTETVPGPDKTVESRSPITGTPKVSTPRYPTRIRKAPKRLGF